MRVDDRPTIAAPDDDPYLWLEEIEGERALDFVEQQNRRTLEKFGGAPFAPIATRWRRSTTGRQHPLCQAARQILYNVWKDANNPRGLWRRTTLDRISHAKSAMGDASRCGPARRGRRQGLAVGLDSDAASNPRAISSLSRGGSDAVTLREFDTGCEGVRRRRLRTAGGKGRRRLDRQGHAAAVERVWRGQGDNFRLCPNRQTMAARRARGSGAGDLRSADRPDGGALQCRRHRPGPAGLVHRPAGFLQPEYLARRRNGRENQNSNCRPMSGWRPIATGSPSNCGPRGRSAGGPRPGRRPRHLAFGLPGRRPQFHRRLRAGATARAAGLVLDRGQTGVVDPRRIAPGVRGLHAPGKRLDPGKTARISRDRGRRRLASRRPRVREQWRPERQYPGSADAAFADAGRRLR